MPPGPFDQKLTIYGCIIEFCEYFVTTMRFKYVIKVKRHEVEAYEWCKQNCRGDWIDYKKPWIDIGLQYRFKLKEDAVAFKLMWE